MRLHRSKKKIYNSIAIVLDDSGSMSHLRKEVVKTYNNLINTIKEESRQNNQDTQVTFIKFANHPEVVYSGVDVGNLRRMTEYDYNPNGSTALFDSVAEAISELEDNARDNESFLVITITDGEENNSSKYGDRNGSKNYLKLVDWMLKLMKTDCWSFVYNVPPGAKQNIVSRFGVPSDNVREWEGTARSMIETGVKTSDGITKYFATRGAGGQSCASFYAETDMSKVKPSDLKNNLVDLAYKFKVLDVNKEMPIKEFVESKTRKDYKIGSAYYELTKPEVVQSYKDVLIMEKGKNHVWGGNEARDLIGLPTGVKAKVTPLDHGKYKIFCNSTSVNRKLVRGTNVLLDLTKTNHSNPTWGTLAGALS